ncbi:MAG: histidine kinase [Roseiarcus sp.]
MPTLFRLLLILAVLAGLAYAGMTALVANVKVEPREMTQIVTLSKAPP